MMNFDQAALDIIEEWTEGIYQEIKPWSQKRANLQCKIVEALKQAKQEQKEKDAKYMNHTYDCIMQNIDGKGECICGLSEYLGLKSCK